MVLLMVLLMVHARQILPVTLEKSAGWFGENCRLITGEYCRLLSQ